MTSTTYLERRGELRTYFDRTAVEAWAKLTSAAPVGRIRAAVRAGRDEMRDVLVSWLPENLAEQRLLDAGCGTGALAAIATRRGARVLGVEIAANLIDIAQERVGAELVGQRQPTFLVADMLDPALGEFDYVVAMDSLIHYRQADVVDSVAQLAARTRRAILFTFAPLTPALRVMHVVGRCFPRGNRAPSIEPLREASLRDALAADPRLAAWRVRHSHRVATSFYCSQAMELVRR